MQSLKTMPKPSPLEDIIKQKIRAEGPISVGAFMGLALGHSEHGYYMKQDPFGRAGDFVTAPEVSQLFGEMIGVWIADVWMQMGSPKRCILLECGPGRGTLMADIMRATKKVDGFHAAADIHLLEISPALKKVQKTALSGFEPSWHENLESVPEDAAIIVLGNEFLDALPFEQLVGEQERRVALDEAGDLAFVPESGEIFEVSSERQGFVSDVCKRLKKQTGAALFVDYGHMKSAHGDTFQAVKGHEYVDVFSHIGDADLTSHVDFEALQDGIQVDVAGPVEQGAFLKGLGVEMRAAMLKQRADEKQGEAVEKGLHRLCNSDQMGALFKVIGFTHHDKRSLRPAGF